MEIRCPALISKWKTYIEEILQKHPIAFPVFLFFFSRLLILFFHSGSIFSPIAQEETIFSTIARERLRGNPIAGDLYLGPYFTSGFWLQTILDAPFIYLFGDSIYAVKLVPILYATLGFAAFFLLAKTYFGDGAARWFFILSILGVPSLLHYQLVGFGNHTELGVFFGPCFLLLFYLLFDRQAGFLQSACAVLFLGFWCVMGIFFCYTTFLYMLFLMILAPLLLSRFCLRFGIAGIVNLALGWAGAEGGFRLIHELRRFIDFKLIGVYANPFDPSFQTIFGNVGRAGTTNEVSQAADFFLRNAPFIFGFKTTLFNSLYYGLFLVGIAAAAIFFFRFLATLLQGRNFRASMEKLFQPDGMGPALLAGFLAVYMAAMSVNSYSPITHQGDFYEYLMSSRFYTPVIPVVFLLFAAVAERLRSIGGTAVRLSQVFLAAALILGLGSMVESTGRPLAGRGMKSVRYEVLSASIIGGAKLQAKYSGFGPEKACELLRAQVLTLDPSARKDICWPIENDTRCGCPLDPANVAQPTVNPPVN